MSVGHGKVMEFSVNSGKTFVDSRYEMIWESKCHIFHRVGQNMSWILMKIPSHHSIIRNMLFIPVLFVFHGKPRQTWILIKFKSHEISMAFANKKLWEFHRISPLGSTKRKRPSKRHAWENPCHNFYPPIYNI